MNRGSKALILSVLTLVVGASSVFVLVKINQGDPAYSRNTNSNLNSNHHSISVPSPTTIPNSPGSNPNNANNADILIDRQDHSINVLVFALTVFSIVFGFVYWIFGILDAKEKLELERHQKELSDNILNKINTQLEIHKDLLHSYKDKLSNSIDQLELSMNNKSASDTQAFAHIKQLIEEVKNSRLQDKELFNTEVKHVSHRLDSFYQHLQELQDNLGQMEGFLQKTYYDYVKLRSPHVGPFIKNTDYKKDPLRIAEDDAWESVEENMK